MLTLTETRDDAKVLAFIQGEGVKRRLTGGVEAPANAHDLIQSADNHTLLAFDEGKPVGFISLMQVLPRRFAIHVCLHTMGMKTKKLIAMAFNFAAYALDAESIYAIYPASHRAIKALTSYFKFREDTEIMSRYQALGMNEPLMYERLDLLTQ